MKTQQTSTSSKIKQFRPWRSSSEIPLTIFGVFWFILCTFLMSLVNVYLDRINPFLNPPPGERLRLPDPLLDAIHPSYVKDNLPPDLSDTLVHIAPAIMLLRVVLGGFDASLILRRLGYTIGTGYLVRILFVLMTILPNSNVNCVVEKTSLLNDAVLVMLQMRQTCGDVVFSGHTIMFMSASLVWIENPVKWLKPYPILRHTVHTLLILYSFLGIFSLVASAYHYSIDCVISVFTMLFFWKFYHYVVNTNHLDGSYVSIFLLAIDGKRRLMQEVNNTLPMLEYDLPTPYSSDQIV